MSTVILHPGIETEYVFNSWDEAREFLERIHGGLAPGMLANCREIERTDLVVRLIDAGVDDQGREWNDTLFRQIQGGAWTLRLSDMAPADRRELQRVLRLSDRVWAKWFFTDAVGNASLLCWQKWPD